MRLTIGRRRPVVEHIERLSLSDALALLKGVRILPELLHLMLTGGETHIGVDFSVHDIAPFFR